MSQKYEQVWQSICRDPVLTRLYNLFPYRVRSPRNDITPHNGAPAGDFLYLQRLQELSRSREQSSTDTSVRSEKKRSNGKCYFYMNTYVNNCATDIKDRTYLSLQC